MIRSVLKQDIPLDAHVMTKIRNAIMSHVAEIASDYHETIYKRYRRVLIGSIRNRVYEYAPQTHKNLFRKILKKSDTRATTDKHVGRGIHAKETIDAKIQVGVYARDKTYGYRSARYGYNEYWAARTGIYGRGAIRPKKAKMLFIPLKVGGRVLRKPGSKYPIGKWRQAVRAWYPTPRNWFDKATEAVVDDLEKELGL